MDDTEIERRKRLDFLQAEGLAELPRQYRKHEIPQIMRAKLWQIIRKDIEWRQRTEKLTTFAPSLWLKICGEFYVDVLESFNKPDNSLQSAISPIFTAISQGEYGVFYNTLQWLIRNKDVPANLKSSIGRLLESERAGVRLVAGDCLLPLTDEAERQALEGALAIANASSRQGMQAHLRNAMQALQEGSFGDSVRESVHAVESVARSIAPEAKTLGDALTRLKGKGLTIHPALEKGFSNIYGYTSDEKGVRHALIDAPVSRVDEPDAIYMLGACASFAAYLERKAATLPPDSSA